jgi:hypothetical protein
MYTRERLEAAGLHIFRNFVAELWSFLTLPPPTRVQCEIADFMQYGPDKIMVQAFRGEGKSYLADAHIIHGWMLNPNTRNITLSATQDFANELAGFVHQIIRGWDLVQYLQPRPDQRQSVSFYEVSEAKPDKAPSLKSMGIMGQITGSRADVVYVDDVEVPKNSFTHDLRQKLSNQIREVGGALLKPNGRVIYLGTPQSEQSIYRSLAERGYEIRVWPAEIPSKPQIYVGRLSPSIYDRIKAGEKAGSPVDPARFNRDELDKRQAEYGLSGYALQFQLDTSPSDAEKHPLKLRDLIVSDLDTELTNIRYVWGTEANNRSTAITDIPVASLEGDSVTYRPSWKSDEMAHYTGRLMFIDPSGKGKDETSYAIVFHLHGQLFLMKVGGFKDGFSVETLNELAKQALTYKVNRIVCEPNYGGGMFTELLKPVVNKIHTCAIEDAQWSKGQKELRIIDTLRPVMQQHRLIVDRNILVDDHVQGEKNPQYSFFYQMTRITKDPGCLPHEDRLEAVAGAVSEWVMSMARDTEEAAEDHKKDLLVQEAERTMARITTRVTGFNSLTGTLTAINLNPSGTPKAPSKGRWRK